jgi:uncharacterized RDD family membrane protein YckC
MLVYEIETPENVRFTLERAGICSRAVAWGIDVALMAALLELVAVASTPLSVLDESVVAMIWLLSAFVVQWGYGALCEWRLRGRTVGKWVLGLSAMDAGGGPISFGQALIRNLMRVIDWLPGLYLVGGCCALLDPAGRRLGDLAARTVVVRERRLPLPTLQRSRDLDCGYPMAAGAARRLHPAERDAVMALCAQRDALPVALRIALFERLARHLEGRLRLQRPSHLSSEKLVLGVRGALTAAQSPRRSALDDLPRAIADETRHLGRARDQES